MDTYHLDNVPVSVRTSADGTSVMFGCMIEGVFIPFHWAAIGGFRDDMATEAQDEAKYAPGPTADAAPAVTETPSP